MTLERRIARLEAQPHGHGVTHTPPVIFYEADEEIRALIPEATVCMCCTVHVVLPMKGRR